MPDAWNPAQYHRFAAERRQPFVDLLALVAPVPGGRVADLGCGTGELTAELHRASGAAETVGVDASEAMLAEGRGRAGGGLRFAAGDIAAFPDDDTAGPFDVVFSNAALQWVPDHPGLLTRLAGVLNAGGQLAFQVPANFDHPSHAVARELGAAAGVPDRVVPVMAPEDYAEALDALGFEQQLVRLQVYGHHLASTDDVVEWVRGTLLTSYQAALSAEEFDAFLASYRAELRSRLGDRRPYFYAFKRILVWGRRAP